jgi:hypothetical protein
MRVSKSNNIDWNSVWPSLSLKESQSMAALTCCAYCKSPLLSTNVVIKFLLRLMVAFA